MLWSLHHAPSGGQCGKNRCGSGGGGGLTPAPSSCLLTAREAGVLLSFRNQRRAWETLFPRVVQCPHLTIEVTEA